MEDRNKYKEQEQKIEKGNNYGIYLSYYIDTNIRNGRGGITTDPMGIKWIIRNELIYAHKFDNLDEMDQFLERNNLPKLIQKKQSRYSFCPFWCLCQKLSLSPLYFNKTLLHKSSEWSSLLSGPGLNSSPLEAKNPGVLLFSNNLSSWGLVWDPSGQGKDACSSGSLFS